MAKTWQVGEAIKEIMIGNKEAIQDIGNRYPMFLAAAATIKPMDTGVLAIVNAIPERVSVRVIEAALKGEAADDTSNDEGKDANEVKANDSDKKKDEKPSQQETKQSGGDDYESMGAYKLYCMCKERGLEVKSKQPKDVYVEALRKDDAAKSGGKYSSMTAQELFKECKSRGIKVEPKKKAAEYIKLLEADDAAADAEESDDDWDDGDSGKEEKGGKSNKKDDDDDDWDI